MFCSGRNLFMKVGFLKKIRFTHDVHCVLKCSIPVLYHGNIPSGRFRFLQRLIS